VLKELSIKNYALIEELHVSFKTGFTCITGETGAGKSILLGGLSLVLGKRADLSALQEKTKKCTIEAVFEIGNYALQSFFEENDLDYDAQTIVRREILPSGKSRAFVNDTPVVLTVLSNLGNRLIDVHSQHQTLQLTEHDFQLRVIDALADNKAKLSTYNETLQQYRAEKKELERLITFQQESDKEQDYNSFLLNELMGFPMEENMQQRLEEEYEQLNNVETIMELLSKGHQMVNDEQLGISASMFQLKQVSQQLAGFGKDFEAIAARIQSIGIELDDIAQELDSLQESVEANPQLMEEVNTKLQMLYDLQKKHHVSEIEDLIAIREDLEQKVAATLNVASDIEKKEAECKF